MDSTQSAHVRNGGVLNAVQTAQQLALTHTPAKLCESLVKQLRKRPAAAAASAKHFRSPRARSLSEKSTGEFARAHTKQPAFSPCVLLFTQRARTHTERV
jgi:hypothetical protein